MPDPTRLHQSVAHTNGHHHYHTTRFSLSRRPIRSRPAYPTTTSALAHVVGPAVGTQCGEALDALGADSPLWDPERLCGLGGASCRLDGNVKRASNSVQTCSVSSSHG